MDHAAVADKLIALINSKPWSPRRDDIVAILAAATPPPAQFPITVAPVRAARAPSPCVILDPTGTVIVEGWSVHGGGAFSYFAPPMSAVKLAVLEYCRQQVLKEAA